MKYENHGTNPPPITHYPHDRATGFVILKEANGKWYGFGTKTLKERFVVAAHYSGHGLEFII